MKRYDTLDALRGVAAAAVVVLHMNMVGLTPDLVPHGHLAVDFFFELSGLVLALANRTKLAEGMSFKDFTVRRLIRIYPMALAGVLLAVAVNVAQWYKHAGGELPADEILRAASFNIFLLPNPNPTSASYFALFLGNAAIWSLFFEVGINLIWAAGVWRLSSPSLGVVCLLCGGVLAFLVIQHGDAAMGSTMPTIWGGAARVSFGFLLGTLIEVGGWRLPAPSSPRFGVVLGVALLVVLFAPGMGVAAPYYDLACIVLIFPVVILLGMTGVRGGKVSRFLGAISYPLYAIHFPILYAARLVWRAAAGHVPLWAFCTLTFGACIAASYITLKVFDEPIRAKAMTLWRTAWRFEEHPQESGLPLLNGWREASHLFMVRTVHGRVERRLPTIDEFRAYNRAAERRTD